jgi:hypothetical protein
MSEDLILAMTKVSLKPGDALIITMPNSFTEEQVQELESSLRYSFCDVLAGVALLLIREESKVFVRHHPEPQGAANLRRLIAPSGAVN